MKQVKLLLLALCLTLLSPANMRGAEVQGYQVDFEKEITTSAHDFKVASNWGHIVHKYVDDYGLEYWMSYSYSKGKGVNGSNALLASEQRAGDNWDYEDTHDLLVTPKVSGEIKIKVKANHSSKGYIEFYKLNETATQYSGDPIASYKASTDAINITDYTEVSCTVDDMQRIGIRASYVYLDDFWAETADIEPEKSIRILTAEPSQTSGAIYWDQQPDKSVLVKFTNVTVENNGEVDLTRGESKFSISVINGNTKAPLGAPVYVPQNLKVGDTSEPFEVSVSIPDADISSLWPQSYSSAKIYLMENLQGSIVQRANSYYNAYESKFCFQTAESTSSSSISDPIDFGMVTDAVSKEFKIKNDGAAPLQIVSVSLPDGYTSTFPAGTFEVGAHGQLDVTLTMTADPGLHNGDLQIVYKDNSGNNATYTLPLKGHVIGATTWYTKFQEDGSSSIAYPLGSVAESGIRDNYKYSNGIYDRYLYSYTSADYAEADNKFITPLLHAQAGDVMTFDVARESSNSKYNLKVYVSTDRVNWGEPQTTIGYDDLTDTAFETRSISFAEEGDYYIGFAVYGMKLDNIVGLQKVDVAHDIYFAEIKQDEEIQSGKEFSPSVDVIAPLAATAADYTVKYYINGDVAATIDSKNMDANAKTKKTFYTGKISKSVETTSVFPTYYEFAFTDGTVFKSPAKDLKITNDPWFVFLKAGTTVNYDHQATNYNSAIDFGTGNKVGLSQNFEILNWGTAPLTVKSITVPEGFSVNVAEATIAAKERQTVDVTFSAETAGTYAGQLTVVYVDANGEDATFTLDVKGTLLDPNKWYAPFNSATNPSTSEWPAGSLHGSNLSITKDSGFATAAMYSNSTSSDMFITPLLRAEAGESFSFNARIYNWTSATLEVYAAKTRDDLENADARINFGKWSGENIDEEHLLTTENRTITLTFEEAGDYYLGFLLSNRTRVDDISGLSVVPVVHDAVISASEVPADGMQNTDATASITLQNIGLNTEAEASYTVATYVNGVKSYEIEGSELPTVTSLNDAGVKMEVPFRSPKAGTFPVYLEVNFGDGYELTTEPVDVTFAEETLSAEVVVGTANGTISDCPLYLNYNKSESVCLYTPTELGLNNGDKIKSIVLRGYGKDALTSDLVIAYEWTDDKTQARPTESVYDISGMTECLNESGHEWNTTGTSSNLVDLITIEFSEPIVYETGKSLRLVMKSTSSSYKNYYFEKSTTTGQSYSQWKDNPTALNGDWRAKNSPVLHLTLAVEPRAFAPTVVDGEGNAVAGATVALISNDGDNVQYEGTTGEDGKCSINVIQSGRTYDVEVKSEAGEAYLDGVSVEEASFVGDIVLLPVVNITDESVHTEGKDAAVVYLNTVFEPGFNAVALPFALDATEVAELFGEDCTVMEFASETRTGNEVKAHFETVKTGMEAGKPYLVYLTGSTAPAMYKNKAVATQLQTVAKTELSFVPATEATALGAGMYLLTEDNYEHTSVNRANAIETVKPYRAYMRVSDPNVTAVSFDNSDDIQTGIEDIEADAFGEDDVIYNLQGIRVTNPVKGNIYIVNGKAVVIK